MCGILWQAFCAERNIIPNGMWNWIHVGADLVTKDGREWIKPSHATDGERGSIKHTCGNVIANPRLTQSSWTSAIYSRQLLDIFAAPPKPLETKQCKVMSLLWLIQTSCGALWAVRDLPSVSANVCACFCCWHTLNKTRLRTQQFLRKNMYFIMMDPKWKLVVKWSFAVIFVFHSKS